MISAESDERARWLAGPGALSFLRLRSGRPGRFPTPEEADAYPYTAAERVALEERLGNQVIGGPESVRRGLEDLLDRTAADEIMVTTMVHEHEDRMRSYEIVAELGQLGMRAAA